VRVVERRRAVSAGELAGSIEELLALRVERRAAEGKDLPNESVIPERII